MADDSIARSGADEAADDEAWLMANLPPRLTGLPMIVWVQERGGARHDVRVKVNPTHGPRVDYRNLVSVAVRPVPRVIPPGQLNAADFGAVSDWIALNRATIIDYWDGTIYTDEMLQRLLRLP